MPICFQLGRRIAAVSMMISLLAASTWNQEPGNQLPTIDQYYPESMLKVARTEVRHARYPAIDIHSHFGLRLKGEIGRAHVCPVTQ